MYANTKSTYTLVQCKQYKTGGRTILAPMVYYISFFIDKIDNK